MAKENEALNIFMWYVDTHGPKKVTEYVPDS